MLEIITEVLEAEKKAEALVAEAKKSAQAVQSAFEEEERERIQKVRAENEGFVREQLKKAQEETNRRFDSAVAAEREKADSFINRVADTLEKTAEEAAKLIIETEQERAGHGSGEDSGSGDAGRFAVVGS